MLSEKVVALCEQILELNRTLDDLVKEETDGKYGLCRQDWIQLWADTDVQHDLKELEDLVGPTKLTYVDKDGCMHFGFALGGARCSILMRADTSDSRGEADAVCTEEETR